MMWKNTARFLLFVFMAGAVYSQVSIYNGADPWRPDYRNGELIKIHIEEYFSVEVKNEWTENTEMELNLVPDEKYFDFLQGTTQSRQNSSKRTQKNTVREKFEVTLMARAVLNDENLLELSAVKSVVFDERQSIIQITGITHPRYVKKGEVSSSDVAELNIQLSVKPPLPRSNQPENLETEGVPVLSDEQKTQILLQYIREILGALEQE